MDTSSYVVLSRQIGLFQKMDTIANNIANANTDGYRSESMLFEEYLAGKGADGRDVSFTRNVATHTNTSQGTLKVTGRPMDAAIEGEGFFVVSTPVGERYTRVGRFHANEQGVLVNAQGHTVMSGGSPISLSTGDSNVEFDVDGTLTVQSATGEREPRGKVDVVRFDDQQLLIKNAGNLYSTNQAATPAIAYQDYRVSGGVIENSNVNSTKEMTDMVKVSRSVGSTSKFINAMDEMYGSAITTLSKQY